MPQEPVELETRLDDEDDTEGEAGVGENAVVDMNENDDEDFPSKLSEDEIGEF